MYLPSSEHCAAPSGITPLPQSETDQARAFMQNLLNAMQTAQAGYNSVLAGTPGQPADLGQAYSHIPDLTIPSPGYPLEPPVGYNQYPEICPPAIAAAATAPSAPNPIETSPWWLVAAAMAIGSLA